MEAAFRERSTRKPLKIRRLRPRPAGPHVKKFCRDVPGMNENGGLAAAVRRLVRAEITTPTPRPRGPGDAPHPTPPLRSQRG